MVQYDLIRVRHNSHCLKTAQIERTCYHLIALSGLFFRVLLSNPWNSLGVSKRNSHERNRISQWNFIRIPLWRYQGDYDGNDSFQPFC